MISRGTNRCMDLCNHEEADTRILVHLQDALNSGATTCFVRTVDTDVVVIVAGKFHALLTDHPAADVWIAFGTGKNFIHIHINEICSALGKDRSKHFPYSIALLAVIQRHRFLGRERNQHGRLGSRIQM